MSDCGARLAAAARTFVGAPFRLGGRDPATGLDCIGLVQAAMTRIGRPVMAPGGYTLRNASLRAFRPFIAEAGWQKATSPIASGDLIIASTGPAQFHCLLAIEQGRVVHAHAGLRQVVECAFPARWPIIDHFRLTSEEG